MTIFFTEYKTLDGVRYAGPEIDAADWDEAEATVRSIAALERSLPDFVFRELVLLGEKMDETPANSTPERVVGKNYVVKFEMTDGSVGQVGCTAPACTAAILCVADHLFHNGVEIVAIEAEEKVEN